MREDKVVEERPQTRHKLELMERLGRLVHYPRPGHRSEAGLAVETHARRCSVGPIVTEEVIAC